MKVLDYRDGVTEDLSMTTTHTHKPGDEVLVETSKAMFEAVIVNYAGNGTYNVRSDDSNRVYLVGFRSIRSAR